LQRTKYPTPETPLKALFSLPVLLSLLAMVGFYSTVRVADKTAIMGGTDTENASLNTANIIKDAEALKPFKLMKKGKLVESMAAAQTLHEQYPNDPKVLYCTAVILNKSGRKDDAYQLMKRVLAQAPGNRPLRMAYAHMLVEGGKIDEGIFQLNKVIQMEPKSVAAHRELAQIYINSNHPLDAAKELQEVIKLSPKDNVARKMCGIALARGGKEQEGMDEYLSGVINAGESEGVKIILEIFGDLQKAKFNLEHDARERPDDPLPRLRLAEIELYADHPAEAKAHLMDARKLAPDNPDVLRSLCVTYKRLGDNRQALICFMQSIALEQQRNSSGKGAH
jgi:predicted Zn-dependent protease